MRIPTVLTALLLTMGLAAPALASAGDTALEIGDIMHFAGAYTPVNWASCDGSELSPAQNPQLYFTLGTTFGGEGWAGHYADRRWVETGTFKLPLLPAAAPGQPRPVICLNGNYMPQGDAGDTGVVGMIRLMTATHLPANWVPCNGKAFDKRRLPYLYGMVKDTFGPGTDLTFRVPTLPEAIPQKLLWAICFYGGATPTGYIGEMRRWPAAAAVPDGWMACDGRTLPLLPNAALYSFLGTQYGGDGQTKFQIPKLPDEAGVRWILCTQGAFALPY